MTGIYNRCRRIIKLNVTRPLLGGGASRIIAC